jgi:hypothetical protein
LFAHAEHIDFGLAEAGGKAGKVGIRGDDAEAVKAALVQKVHCVDDERRVRRVFPRDIGILLDGLNRVVENHRAPAAHLRHGPVAVNALDVHAPEVIGLREDNRQVFRGDVLGINQHGDTALVIIIVHGKVLSVLT